MFSTDHDILYSLSKALFQDCGLASVKFCAFVPISATLLGLLFSFPGGCMTMPHLSDVFRLAWYKSDPRYITYSTRYWAMTAAEVLLRLLVLGGGIGVSIWIGT